MSKGLQVLSVDICELPEGKLQRRGKDLKVKTLQEFVLADFPSFATVSLRLAMPAANVSQIDGVGRP